MANDDKIREIAKQLRRPDGAKGLEIAAMMQESNAKMIAHSLQHLDISPDDQLLELGPGNGAHLASIYSHSGPKKYHGLDISETMIDAATQYNQTLVQQDLADFVLYDGFDFPYESNYFNKIFTVNTVYFWEDPLKTMSEFERVLRPGGQLNITFVDRQFMSSLPFTKFGFALYDEEAIKHITNNHHFEIKDLISDIDQVKSPQGDTVVRKFWTILLKKRM